MKITNAEKVVMGVLAVAFLLWVMSTVYTINRIQEAGGMKALIINMGKEVKDIGEQINGD